MALKEKTRKEDQRLREELKNANVEKFKQMIRPLIAKKEKSVKPEPKRGQ